MEFIEQTTDLDKILAERVTSALLKYNHVVWLVPGGSNIPITIGAMAHLDEPLSAKLTIMQTDERFVPKESPDCNWKQLMDAGFDTKQAKTFPILTGESDLEKTTREYAQIVEQEFALADHIIGQFGIGPDGHIAGIKPNSSATVSEELVCGYKAEDFMRITLTFPAIKRMNELIAFVHGENKRDALLKIQDNNLPLEELPAAILRTSIRSTIVNNLIAN